MFVYDESYYDKDYLNTLNSMEQEIMYNGSYVAQMGLTYAEVADYIKEGKLTLVSNYITSNFHLCTIYCSWNGNSKSFHIYM